MMDALIRGKPLLSGIDSVIDSHFLSAKKWSYTIGEDGNLYIHIELGETLEAKEIWAFEIIPAYWTAQRREQSII